MPNHKNVFCLICFGITFLFFIGSITISITILQQNKGKHKLQSLGTVKKTKNVTNHVPNVQWISLSPTSFFNSVEETSTQSLSSVEGD